MEIETDVLVIGAGASGLTAALAAAEDGAKVTVIEKYAQLGGTAAISGGVIWIADNPRQRAEGMIDSKAEALAYFRALDQGDLDEDTLTAFVEEGPDAIGFLESIDALSLSILPGYPDYYLDRPGAKPEGGRALDHNLFSYTELGAWAEKIFAYEEKRPMTLRETPLGGGTGIVDPAEMERRLGADERGFGQAMVGRLLKACLARGIEPMLEVETERLAIESGRITGVEAMRGGEALRIRTSMGVVIATGGFEWDADLKQTFLRGPMDAPASPPSNRGDGLRLAMAAGATLGNMTSAWWAPTVAPSTSQWAGGAQRAAPVLIERTVPHSILVNRFGERFCNEAANYSALAGAFHQFDPQSYDYRNLPAWLIFDQQYRDRYPIEMVMPGDDLPAWIAKGKTPIDLAEQIGVDGPVLEATIARFNTHARNGEDPDFDRGTSTYDHFYGDHSREGKAVTLGPLDQAPYYAVEIKMGLLGTNGGPKTDGSARILGHGSEPVPGLYGAGNAIACPTGGVYAGAGGTLGPALTYGYIAGRSAARRENR